jgi:anti-sigma B factor antagonist
MAIQENALTGPAQFVAEVRNEDNVTIVLLSGELDVSNAGALRECLVAREIIGSGNLRLDLRGVSFLDSSIIGILVSACKRVRSDGGVFSICCKPGPVRRALEITGLLGYLHVEAASS